MRKFIVSAMLSLALFAGNASAQEPEQQRSEDQPFQLNYRLALGIGVPYGGKGGNLEARLGRHFGATVGLGVMDSEFGWAGGVRAYPLGYDLKVSPRLSAYYGTVAMINWPDGSKETDAGAGYGVGVNWNAHPNISADFELLYLAYPVPSGYTRTDNGNVKLVLGYGWHF